MTDGSASRRLFALDALRGAAILWVIAFHLSTDAVGFSPLDHYYSRVGDNLGNPLAAGRAVWSLFLRLGYQGVPVFIMASGFAMTYTAAAVRSAPPPLPFWMKRLRTLLVPYALAWALTVGVIALLAVIRSIDGGSVGDQFWHGTRMGEAPYPVTGEQLLAGLTLIPRGWRAEWAFAPSPSLWFVLLFAQFYLAFPFLYRALERLGPWPFIAVCVVVTFATRAPLVLAERGYGLLFYWWIDNNYLPFNLFTFGLGMTLAWLYVHQRETVRSYTAGWLNASLLIYAGLIVQTVGSLAQGRSGAIGIIATPMIVLGLTMIVLPWLAGAPQAAPRSAVLAAVAWLGTISYSLLIASDPFRFVIGTLHSMDAPRAVWALFWLAYAPALLLIALGVDSLSKRLLALQADTTASGEGVSSKSNISAQ